MAKNIEDWLRPITRDELKIDRKRFENAVVYDPELNHSFLAYFNEDLSRALEELRSNQRIKPTTAHIAHLAETAKLAPEVEALSCIPRAVEAARSMVERGERFARPIMRRVQAEIDKEPLATAEFVSLRQEGLKGLEAIDPDEAAISMQVRIGKVLVLHGEVLTRKKRWWEVDRHG